MFGKLYVGHSLKALAHGREIRLRRGDRELSQEGAQLLREGRGFLPERRLGALPDQRAHLREPREGAARRHQAGAVTRAGPHVALPLSFEEP